MTTPSEMIEDALECLERATMVASSSTPKKAHHHVNIARAYIELANAKSVIDQTAD